MLPYKPRKPPAKGPEAKIKEDIIAMLKLENWFTIITHGNLYQHGLPDIYATHSEYGPRWIEVKVKDHYKFTRAQIDTFPKMCANGSGVWILVEATHAEYMKLFRDPNWWQYLSVMK